MKKSIIYILSILFLGTIYAQSIKWTITNECDLFSISWDGINFENTGKTLYPNTEVIGVDSSIYKDPKSNIELVKIEKYDKFYIDVNCIIPSESEDYFDNEIITTNLKRNNKLIVSEKYFKALQNKDRNLLIQIENNGYKDYQQTKGDLDYEWFDSLNGFNKSYIYNPIISFVDIFSYYDLMVKKITKQNDSYYVLGEITYWKNLDYNGYSPAIGDVIEIVIQIDGDYINIYYQNNILSRFIITDKKTAEQIDTFIRTNSANYSEVRWPSHKNGLSEYSSQISNKESKEIIKLKTNVSVNKKMTVQENLKLRSGEATTTTVLTVMQAGTKVKILELGKAETIDGIDSNWVKVEVQKGAKDRNGKEIKEGTVGWCYGGYLK